MNDSERLAAIYEKKAQAGLVDVKFTLTDVEDATPEIIYGEVLRLEEAIERGDVTPLDFNDSHRN
jgi:hypothetical protein